MEVIINKWLLAGIPVLLVVFIILKMLNSVKVKNFEAQSVYREIRRRAKKKPLSKALLIVGIASSGILGLYLIIVCCVYLIILFYAVFTLGGIVTDEALPDGVFFGAVVKIADFLIDTIRYFWYLIYPVAYSFLIRGIYTNIYGAKNLKEQIKLCDLQQRRNTSGVAKFLIIFIGSIFTLIGGLLLIGQIQDTIETNRKIDVQDILDNSTHGEKHFFYGDRFYGYDRSKGAMYSVNMEAKDKWVNFTDRELEYADIYLVYDEMMYLYTPYDNSMRAVDVGNGVTKVLQEDSFSYILSDTISKGYVWTTYYKNEDDVRYSCMGKMSLETGDIKTELKVPSGANQPYFFDLESENVYCIVSGFTQNYVYENEEHVFTYETGTNGNDDLIFVQDEYLFIATGSTIMKVDVTTWKVVDEKEDDTKYGIISSVDWKKVHTGMEEEYAAHVAMYPVFTKSDSSNIFVFDSKSMTFEEKVETESKVSCVQKYKEHYVINCEEEIVVYNIETGAHVVYDAVFATVQTDHIYLVVYKDKEAKTYELKKVSLNN